MEARTNDDAVVGKIEILKITPVLREAVSAVRLNLWTIRLVALPEGSSMPKFPSRLNRSRISQRRNPASG